MKHKRKSIGRLILVLSGMILVVWSAWQLPGLVFSVYDRNTLQRKGEIRMELYSFEKEGTWADRLYSLALRSSEPSRYQMSSALMKTENDMLSDEELTKIVNEELKSMEEFFILTPCPEIQAQELVSRELYMAYIKDNEKNMSEGSIAFWKLSYKSQDQENGYDLELVLDMEYHKLYAIRLSDEMFIEEGEILAKPNKKRLFAEYEERCWVLMDRLENYYKLRNNTTYQIGTALDEASWTNSSMTDTYDKTIVYENTNTGETIMGMTEDVIWYAGGTFLFYTEEDEKNGKDAHIRLPFHKKYSMEDERISLYIGVRGLDEILQI